MRNSSKFLSFWQLLCYGVLTTPLAMGGLALVIFIPTFYAVDMGLGLAAVGAVFVFGRIFDVITDPLVGHLSDQTKSRFGARKPWMLVGLPFFCLAIWFLLMPPEGAGVIFLVFVSGAYFLFYTIVDVPYSSIGLEISPHVHERSMLASSKAVFQVIGAITAASIPFVLALSVPDSLGVIAKSVVVLCLIGFVLFILFMPKVERRVTAPKIGFVQSIKFILKHRVFRYLLGSFFIIQSANALTAGLMVLYVTHVIGSPDLVGAFLGLLFLSTALFLPVWVILSRKFTKKTAWMTSMIFCSLGLVSVVFLGQGSVIGFAIFSIILGASFGCDAIMPTSMLADVVSETEKDGQNRYGATYLAIKNAVSKLTFVVPMGLAFPVLDLMEFEEKGQNGDTQILTLVFFFAILPIVLRCMAFFVVKIAPMSTAELALENE
ncbi:MAG: MFS transporter [Lentilitoribacter sp.]